MKIGLGFVKNYLVTLCKVSYYLYCKDNENLPANKMNITDIKKIIFIHICSRNISFPKA